MVYLRVTSYLMSMSMSISLALRAVEKIAIATAKYRGITDFIEFLLSGFYLFATMK